ncbi:hypothetical protein [Nonomuraea insulae]|uniref:Uncharacterized protein n=1 Tax=Nonomuraea insulae TaxID=1616787 RepID=A0ABW1CPE8_9ACTN
MDVTDVHGTVANGFEPVMDAFQRNFAQDAGVGAALTVYQHGARTPRTRSCS